MTMPAKPEWESLAVAGGALGVDRENKVIRGYVVAQRGPFKSTGRGEFDDKSLAMIADMMNAAPKGLKSRFAHPTLSSDGLGKFLGRARNARVDGDRVRADLHLDPSSFATPAGNLGQYVLDLAASDPDALSSSLVVKPKQELRVNPDGTRAKDDKGNPLPPLWRPERLHASDIVDTGEAVDGLLSVDDLPDAIQRRGAEMLDSLFAGQPRDVVEARCLAYLARYLDNRYGTLTDCPDDIGGLSADVLRGKLKLKALEFSS